MAVQYKVASSKVEKADTQDRGRSAVIPHPAQTPRGKRRAEKKK